jgi:hypothetical protein
MDANLRELSDLIKEVRVPDCNLGNGAAAIGNAVALTGHAVESGISISAGMQPPHHRSGSQGGPPYGSKETSSAHSLDVVTDSCCMCHSSQVNATARHRSCRLSFAFVYPDKHGRNVMRQVGMWGVNLLFRTALFSAQN